MYALSRPRNVIALAAGLALLVAAFFVIHSGGARASSSAPVVRTAKNAALGKTILVNSKGLSLYALSVERKGRFICTDKQCLSFWSPLLAPMGRKPAGLAGLGTIKRPDHRVQVTYKGAPLYSSTSTTSEVRSAATASRTSASGASSRWADRRRRSCHLAAGTAAMAATEADRPLR